MSGTILYDGECALCNSQVRFIKGRNRGDLFRFVSLQSEEGKNMLRMPVCLKMSWIQLSMKNTGRYYKRSSPLFQHPRDLGGGWSLLRVLGIIPSGIRDFFYRLIARNRHRLSRKT